MFDKFKEIIPGTMVSLAISFITYLVFFSGTFSALTTEVKAQGETLKMKVDKNEYEAILKSQDKMNDNFDRRFDRLEQKIDRINERLK